MDRRIQSAHRGSRSATAQETQEIADLLLAAEPIWEGHVGPDRVVVAAAFALTRDIPSCGELADDPMRGPFCDSDRFADNQTLV